MENVTNKNGLLLTRFPLESALGGEEKLHLTLLEELQKKEIPVGFWGSCSVLWRALQQKNSATGLGENPLSPLSTRGRKKERFFLHRARFVRDLTSKKSLLLSPFYALSLLFQSLVVLPWARIKGMRTILMLTLIEKVFLTPIALAFGYRVLWGHHAPLGDWFFRNLFFFLWKLWSRWVTIIVPSRAMREELLPHAANPEKVNVLLNPLLPFSRTKKVFNKKKQSGEIVVGTATRLSPEKDLPAFLGLARAFPRTSFWIAGEGALRSELEQAAPKNVTFLGFVEDMQGFLGQLDVFCLLSKEEPFGLSALEASSQELPVLVTKVGGLQDLVQHGETGYVTSDPEEQKIYLRNLLEDKALRKKMGKRGKTWSEEFSLEYYMKTVKQLLLG